MCYYDFRVLLRDAVIHNCKKSEAGREYLDKCWVMEQTKPERAKLREKTGKQKGGITDGG
jgi:hypothetical protein